jgi:excisionase family DNA binding protein
MSADSSSPLLTVAQVAERLACKQDTVRRHILSGRLVGTNIGTQRQKMWRVSPEALDAFLAASSGVTPNKPPNAPVKSLRYLAAAVGATNG